MTKMSSHCSQRDTRKSFDPDYNYDRLGTVIIILIISAHDEEEEAIGMGGFPCLMAPG